MSREMVMAGEVCPGCEHIHATSSYACTPWRVEAGPPQRWCIVTADDGRLYLCPVERRDEVIGRLNAIVAFWAAELDIDDQTVEIPADPDFVREIGNLAHWSFANPREDR